MADLIPYDIKVRRKGMHVQRGWERHEAYRDLDDYAAAGIVAADEDVVVIAVYAAEEGGNHQGAPVGALAASVYVWDGEAVTRWSSSELTWADKRGNIAMRQVLARAQRIADLANDLADGVPIPLEGPVDRVVDEVAFQLQRSWNLAHCSDANVPALQLGVARALSRHAIHRLWAIGQRDGVTQLF